jgi:HD superfamily phosphohydrolase
VQNKRKIINDPLYGFISLPYDIIYDIIESPCFQRLRRIRQLGLTSMVYPGAYNTRFHHAIGAMHLAMEAVEVLRSKGTEITEEESEALAIAILLHDVGHGPFSHALEHSLVKNIDHEDMSIMFMEKLNKEHSGGLSLAIKIFKNQYSKNFLHQLISSQLDVDRLDYLNRDSFYTGVQEGVIGVDRIIKLLNVKDGELVVDQKGIYSIEKFLVARRIMYWQVYLHKTVISAEFLLINILKKAKQLASSGEELFCSPALREFLYNNHSKESFVENPELLEAFSDLDDYDILSAIKVWKKHNNYTLSKLCTWMINRRLYKVEIGKNPISEERIQELQAKTIESFDFAQEDLSLAVFSSTVSNVAYDPEKGIKILDKNGSLSDVIEASDHLNINSLSTPVKKFFVCYPKNI